MIELTLARNSFTGTTTLTGLPKNMELLDLSSNAFCGTADFSQLPPGLCVLHLSHNKFSGGISLSNLPKCFRELGPHDTEFGGDISGYLQGNLMYFNVSNTQLCGGVIIGKPTDNLRQNRIYKAENTKVTIVREN